MLTPVRFKPSPRLSCTPIKRDFGFHGCENVRSRYVISEDVSINLFASAMILPPIFYQEVEKCTVPAQMLTLNFLSAISAAQPSGIDHKPNFPTNPAPPLAHGPQNWIFHEARNQTAER